MRQAIETTERRAARVWFCCAILTVAVCGCSGRDDKAPPAAVTSSPSTPAITAADVAELNRGVGLMGQFDYDGARAVFAKLVAEHLKWPTAQLDLAIATLNRQQTGDLEIARQICIHLLADDKADVRAEYCLGILEFHKGHIESALEHFRRVAKADPNDAFCAYFAGQCLLQLGQLAPALDEFRRAKQLDPYLQSAYYGEFQVLQQLERSKEIEPVLADFTRLTNNPRSHLANIGKGRLGPKAQAETADLPDGARKTTAPPQGPLFAVSVPLPLQNTAGYTWNVASGASGDWPSATVCDIDGDGQLDLFIARGLVVNGEVRNAVLLNRGGKFLVDLDHPLAKVTDVNAALWGDFDNDGLTDVYFCRQAANQLWRQTKPNVWENVTERSHAAGAAGNTIDGAWVDADHDGDLDLLLIRDAGPNQLLINRLDGTFDQPDLARDVRGSGAPSRGLAIADLDRDRDVDFIVLKDKSPHEVFLNDRLWKFHPAENAQKFTNSGDLRACVVADLSGAKWGPTIFSLDGQLLQAWTAQHDGGWTPSTICSAKIAPTQRPQLAVADVTGTGRLACIFSCDGSWHVVSLDDRHESLFSAAGVSLACWTLANFDAARGPAVVGVRRGEPPMIWQPGAGRFPFASFTFSGKSQKAEQMRSNRSGIGVGVAARVDSQWTVLDTYRPQSGPGQSLQPLSIGLNGHASIDFLRLDWPDGIMQTELALPAGKLRAIEETQRQTSSCPLLFAWNGHEWAFVTDVLGVGGVGFWSGPNEYVPPVPSERLLLPSTIRPRDGRWAVKICEAMEEVCYIDAASLVGYDLPPGWRMTLDERMNVASPAATGEPRFFRHTLPIMKAENELGEDVTELLAEADNRAVEPGALDPRFIGLTKPRTLTLHFASPIDAAPLDAAPGKPLLVVDGWLEYPYSQTVFAAWQAGEEYRAPSLEARAGDGPWKMIYEHWGYPAGMPRQMSLPLDGLPKGTTDLRISTNQEIYWDRIFVAWAEDCPAARRTKLPLVKAELSECGFPKRTTFAQHRPSYDYSQRSPQSDTRHLAGWYTRFGPVEELLAHADDAVAIFGPGEEVQMEFTDRLPELPHDWTRQLVLEQHGWCKDMDLYTKDGETVGPLPRRGGDSGAANKSENVARDALHRRYNTRYRAGAD